MIDEILACVGLCRVRPSANLFRTGHFKLSSGQASHLKFDCDALADADWETLATIIARRAGPFSEVVGVPRGGLKLARALRSYVAHPLDPEPRLFVDDVLTTGRSILRHMTRPTDVGFVVFARGKLPPRVSTVLTFEDNGDTGEI